MIVSVDEKINRERERLTDWKNKESNKETGLD